MMSVRYFHICSLVCLWYEVKCPTITDISVLIFSSVHCQEDTWWDRRKDQLVHRIDLQLKSPNHHIRNVRWAPGNVYQAGRSIDILILAVKHLSRKIIKSCSNSSWRVLWQNSYSSCSKHTSNKQRTDLKIH